MRVTLDDKVMKGFLIGLGFVKPKHPTDESIPDKLMDDDCVPIDGRKNVEPYDPNKRKVSMRRERIYHYSQGFREGDTEAKPYVLEETVIFEKKGVEAGLTHHPERNFERQGTQIHCNAPDLEAQLERELSRLPSTVKVQEKLRVIYNHLLGYVPVPIPIQL
ncbi:MAG: hypothetical protein AABX00_01100 [Nanoarchaeota archaeon]